ncbi:hypothetical protein AAC387_Pa05g0550 [Persea americana]
MLSSPFVFSVGSVLQSLVAVLGLSVSDLGYLPKASRRPDLESVGAKRKVKPKIESSTRETEEEDASDEEEASSHGSSIDGEIGEQEDKETGEMEETIKCSLEGDHRKGKKPSFSFGEEVEKTHRGEDTRHGKEKGASGTRSRYAKVVKGERYSVEERGRRGKGVANSDSNENGWLQRPCQNPY